MGLSTRGKIMAWEWSYSQEGLDNIRDNIMDMDIDRAIEALAECKAQGSREDFEGGFDSDTFEVESKRLASELKRNGAYFADIIKEELASQSAKIATCDNGGFQVWICPFGCHTVSAG